MSIQIYKSTCIRWVWKLVSDFEQNNKINDLQKKKSVQNIWKYGKLTEKWEKWTVQNLYFELNTDRVII
jgi:hypothetical protein